MSNYFLFKYYLKFQYADLLLKKQLVEIFFIYFLFFLMNGKLKESIYLKVLVKPNFFWTVA